MDIITANRLSDGAVVFLTASGWSTRIAEAQALEGKESVAAALARAAADAEASIIVEPYPVDVERRAQGLTPTKLRERIRAQGPTVGHSKDLHLQVQAA
ncbi:Protein of unknown function [Faunimonas pinastri]|uniref:DUF2849 domain-containing protein n=1 Tax=Faunimonas pinastri TaxID=1855383 RepID=A0A1H9LWZ4_9HYPH|nr:DUF2849 domain-containing protein [Faunimonas pinastri]SER15878.1 Protein of unknown function [Faunimonas pinastri]